MERMFALLAKFDPRVMLVLLVCMPCLLAFEAWVLVLAKPVAQYRQLAASRAALGASVEASGREHYELSRLAAELKRVSERLTGELRAPGSEDQMAAMLMSELDRSAARGSVMLTGVKPGARRQVQAFEELAFDISAQGRYLMLCEWLMDFEHALGQNATVTEFDMKSADEGRQVAVTLKVALYRPLPVAGASK
jgi:Tfp pilus assembly protein PilO